VSFIRQQHNTWKCWWPRKAWKWTQVQLVSWTNCQYPNDHVMSEPWLDSGIAIAGWLRVFQELFIYWQREPKRILSSCGQLPVTDPWRHWCSPFFQQQSFHTSTEKEKSCWQQIPLISWLSVYLYNMTMRIFITLWHLSHWSNVQPRFIMRLMKRYLSQTSGPSKNVALFRKASYILSRWYAITKTWTTSPICVSKYRHS
jgi:hypothetical protein